MDAGQDVGAGRFDWRGEVERASADTHGYEHGQRTKTLGLIVTTSIFFVLLAATIMFGGHAALGPLVKRAIEARNPTTGTADLVLTMPDGVFCRHMSYDNATGAIIEGRIERCPEHSGGREFEPSRFNWQSH